MEEKWVLAEGIYNLIWTPAQSLLQGKSEINFGFLKTTDVMMSNDIAKHTNVHRVNEQQFSTP
jgi:hypothetical protein